MRCRLAAALLLALFACAPARSAPTPKSVPIHELKVIVHTGEDFGAGTEDAVWFSLGPSYEWSLETPQGHPFRSGAWTTFRLGPNGLNREDIKYVRVRKSRGGDRWLLQGIEVWINGKPYYRNPNIDLWLEDGHVDWTASDFPPGAGTGRDGSGGSAR